MKGEKNLIEGHVAKVLFLFALPMIGGNLLQQCYNLADTWVIGRYVGACVNCYLSGSTDICDTDS